MIACNCPIVEVTPGLPWPAQVQAHQPGCPNYVEETGSNVSIVCNCPTTTGGVIHAWDCPLNPNNIRPAWIPPEVTTPAQPFYLLTAQDISDPRDRVVYLLRNIRRTLDEVDGDYTRVDQQLWDALWQALAQCQGEP